ncbi:MAG: fluoride efflux transporter CrcB [Microbacterium sp.]
MSSTEWTLLIVAGGIGAGARYIVNGLVMRGRRAAFPLGILIVNVSGSFVLGLLTALAALAPVWLAIVGTGLVGGFTTFSTVMVDTVLLAQRRRREWAWLNLVGTLLACVVAAALGILIGGLFPR